MYQCRQKMTFISIKKTLAFISAKKKHSSVQVKTGIYQCKKKRTFFSEERNMHLSVMMTIMMKIMMMIQGPPWVPMGFP